MLLFINIRTTSFFVLVLYFIIYENYEKGTGFINTLSLDYLLSRIDLNKKVVC